MTYMMYREQRDTSLSAQYEISGPMLVTSFSANHAACSELLLSTPKVGEELQAASLPTCRSGVEDGALFSRSSTMIYVDSECLWCYLGLKICSLGSPAEVLNVREVGGPIEGSASFWHGVEILSHAKQRPWTSGQSRN
jgi:hypothetical protein